MSVAPNPRTGQDRRPYIARVAHNPEAPAHHKAIVLAIVAHGGVASYNDLTVDTGLHGSTLQRVVRALETAGVVRRVRVGSKEWVVRLCEVGESPDTPPDQSSESAQPKQECFKSNNTLPAKHTARPPRRPPDRPRFDDPPMVRALIEAGVWRSEATRLAHEHDQTTIEVVIEQAKLWGDGVTNPGGWIRCALDEGWRFGIMDLFNLDPQERQGKIAEAVWESMSEQDRKRLLNQARAANDTEVRSIREIAYLYPHYRATCEATIGQAHIRRSLEARP